mmetsp:Transcript_7748/g.17098  ORF Transcript_7748/g.17098 Transcript_7748/m.17098 type:complete len:136 (-) Transcript_7748:726-1133(-)
MRELQFECIQRSRLPRCRCRSTARLEWFFYWRVQTLLSPALPTRVGADGAAAAASVAAASAAACDGDGVPRPSHDAIVPKSLLQKESGEVAAVMLGDAGVTSASLLATAGPGAAAAAVSSACDCRKAAALNHPDS